MGNIVNNSEDICFQITVKAGEVKSSLLNCFKPEKWNEPDLKLDDVVLSDDMKDMTDEQLANSLWNVVVFGAANLFRATGKEKEDEDIKGVLCKIADEIDALELSKVKIEVVRE